MAFNNSINMLAGFQERKLIVWPVPTLVFTAKDTFYKTIFEVNNSLMDKSAFIIRFINFQIFYFFSFIGNTINVRRADGCLLTFYIPSFLTSLIKCVQTTNYDQAVKICRISNVKLLKNKKIKQF